MKKVVPETDDELRAEYRFDYSPARPNRFAVQMGADEEAVDSEAIATAKQRDLELTSDQVQGRSHDAVMESARRTVGGDGSTTHLENHPTPPASGVRVGVDREQAAPAIQESGPTGRETLAQG